MSICLVCKKTNGYLVPCEKKTEVSSGILLFKPDKCVNEHRVTLTTHPTCASPTLSTSEIVNVIRSVPAHENTTIVLDERVNALGIDKHNAQTNAT